MPQWLADSQPVAAWTIELPATPDFRDHATSVTPPMTTPGAYLIVASARRDFASEGNQMIAHNLVVGDLLLVAIEYAANGPNRNQQEDWSRCSWLRRQTA